MNVARPFFVSGLALALATACAAIVGVSDVPTPIEGGTDGEGAMASGESGSSSGLSSESGSGAESSSGSGTGSGVVPSSGGSGASSSGSSDAFSSSGSGSSSGSASGGDSVDAGGIFPQGGASCITSNCPLHLQSEALQPGASTQAISPSIHISATAPAVDLANVKIHYYYTADGNTSPTFVCDAVHYLNSVMTIAQSAVQGTFVPMGANATPWADTYLEISFPSAMLPVGTTIEVNARFFSPNYPAYNQTNDWSNLSSSSTTYVDAKYITAYLNGTLAWGVEPGGTVSDAGSPGDAATLDADGGG